MSCRIDRVVSGGNLTALRVGVGFSGQHLQVSCDERKETKGKRRIIMKEHIKNVVLVHGAFADGSGWKAVANILKRDGYKVSVAQPPETSYADDQKYTKAPIAAMGGPMILVGQSSGGPIITAPAIHPSVR